MTSYRHKVSVIVPVYKAEQYIERCARSLLSQTLSNVQLIFVDDASPDTSLDCLRKVIALYPDRSKDIVVLRHSKNQGVAAARNTGLQYATGEYIAYCDSDDFVDVDMYRAMYERAIESNADTVLCDFYMCASGVKSEIKTITVSEDKEDTIKSYIGFGWTIISNMICRKSLYDSYSIASPLGVTYCEDFSLTFRLLYYSDKVVQINKAFYYYWCENPDSAMAHRGDRSILDERKVYLDIIDMMERNRELGTYEREISWRILKNKQDLCLNKSSHKEFLSIFPVSHRHITTCPITFCNRKIKIMMWLLSHNMRFVLNIILTLRDWWLKFS